MYGHLVKRRPSCFRTSPFLALFPLPALLSFHERPCRDVQLPIMRSFSWASAVHLSIVISCSLRWSPSFTLILILAKPWKFGVHLIKFFQRLWRSIDLFWILVVFGGGNGCNASSSSRSCNHSFLCHSVISNHDKSTPGIKIVEMVRTLFSVASKFDTLARL